MAAAAAFKRVDPPRNSGKPRRYELGPPLVLKKTALVSVTSLLSALPKPALNYWGRNVVAEAAAEHRDLLMTMEKEEMIEWLKEAPDRVMRSRGRRGTG